MLSNRFALAVALIAVFALSSAIRAENLIDFGSFDMPSDVVPWTHEFENPEIEWDPRDANLSTNSGSIRLTARNAQANSGFSTTRRCYQVTQGLKYQVKARTLIPSGQNRSIESTVFYTFSGTSNCNGSELLRDNTQIASTSGSWQMLDSGMVTAPEFAHSVSIALGNRKVEAGGEAVVLFDDLQLEEFTGDCEPSATRLCISDNRFAVEVEYLTQQGDQGVGTPLGLTPDSGLFWFFEPSNLEVLIKVLDACAINDSYWVYLAATTDVNYRLTVIDTKTNGIRQYINPQGVRAQAVADTEGFPCP